MLKAIDRFGIPRSEDTRRRIGPLPFGFDYIDRRLAKSGVEQAAIRMMRQYHASGVSLRETGRQSQHEVHPDQTELRLAGQYSEGCLPVRDAGNGRWSQATGGLSRRSVGADCVPTRPKSVLVRSLLKRAGDMRQDAACLWPLERDSGINPNERRALVWLTQPKLWPRSQAEGRIPYSFPLFRQASNNERHPLTSHGKVSKYDPYDIVAAIAIRIVGKVLTHMRKPRSGPCCTPSGLYHCPAFYPNRHIDVSAAREMAIPESRRSVPMIEKA